MENKKETAVEWLYTLSKHKPLDIFDLSKAKEMEKEQIVDAYDKGESPFADNGKYLHGIDYYNQFYGE